MKCLSVIGFSLICLNMVSSPFRPTCNYLGGKKDTFNIFLFFEGLRGGEMEIKILWRHTKIVYVCAFEI